MMTITEKAAYIKGLMEGMELDPSKKETKIINALVDIIDELALYAADAQDDIAALQDGICEMEEHIDAVDMDLADVEDILFGDDEDEDECGLCGGCDAIDDADEDWEDDGLYEIACPDCGDVFFFDETAFDSDEPLTCPKCGFVIDEIEFEDEEE